MVCAIWEIGEKIIKTKQTNKQMWAHVRERRIRKWRQHLHGAQWEQNGDQVYSTCGMHPVNLSGCKITLDVNLMWAYPIVCHLVCQKHTHLYYVPWVMTLTILFLISIKTQFRFQAQLVGEALCERDKNRVRNAFHNSMQTGFKTLRS